MTDEKKTETAKEAATVKKAMISQPMAGKTDEEIVATRDLAVAKLRQMGYEVVNTLFTDECKIEHDAATAYGLEVLYEE